MSTIPLTGSGASRKYAELLSLIPEKWNTEEGTVLAALLLAIAEQAEAVAGLDSGGGIRDVLDQTNVALATGVDLTIMGQNVGVERPALDPVNDDLMRQLVVLLSYQQKTVIRLVYGVLTAVFGAQANDNWAVYEVNPNELIVEINVLLSDPSSSTYVYTDETVAATDDLPGSYLCDDETVDGTDEVDDATVTLFGDQFAFLDSIFKLVHASGVVVRYTQKGS